MGGRGGRRVEEMTIREIKIIFRRRSRRKMGQGEWFIYAQFRDLIQRESLEV